MQTFSGISSLLFSVTNQFSATFRFKKPCRHLSRSTYENRIGTTIPTPLALKLWSRKPRPCGPKPGHCHGCQTNFVGPTDFLFRMPGSDLDYPETERGCAHPYYLIRVAAHLSLLWLTSGLCTRIEASFAVDTMGRFCRGHKETGPP